MANKKRLYKTVADMPRVMRKVCEHLVEHYYDHKKWPTEDIALAMGLRPKTIQAHICIAMKAVGVDDRGALAKWCYQGGFCRSVSSGIALHTISVTGPGGRKYDVLRDAAIEALKKHYPQEFLAAASTFREKWRDIGVPPPVAGEKITSLPHVAGESYGRQMLRYAKAGVPWTPPPGWSYPDGTPYPHMTRMLVPDPNGEPPVPAAPDLEQL